MPIRYPTIVIGERYHVLYDLKKHDLTISWRPAYDSQGALDYITMTPEQTAQFITFLEQWHNHQLPQEAEGEQDE